MELGLDNDPVLADTKTGREGMEILGRMPLRG